MTTEVQMTVPEAARRLGLPGGEVYRLIFTGALDGGPAADGAVYVTETAIQRYVAEHGMTGSSPD